MTSEPEPSGCSAERPGRLCHLRRRVCLPRELLPRARARRKGPKNTDSRSYPAKTVALFFCFALMVWFKIYTAQLAGLLAYQAVDTGITGAQPSSACDASCFAPLPRWPAGRRYEAHVPGCPTSSAGLSSLQQGSYYVITPRQDYVVLTTTPINLDVTPVSWCALG
jgi:hypothetical protein